MIRRRCIALQAASGSLSSDTCDPPQLNMFRFSLLSLKTNYGIAILYRVEVEKLYCLIQNYSRRLK